MSGPKCFEVRETTLNNARRSNRADCEATLAEYRRLFRQYSELTDRARSVEVAAPSPATDPARLAKRVATVFANSRDDGLAVVHELYREKQLLESHLSQLAAAVQEQVATLQRRLRELRREVGKLREDRLQFERNLENAVPPNWPQTEAARIRTQGLPRCIKSPFPTQSNPPKPPWKSPLSVTPNPRPRRRAAHSTRPRANSRRTCATRTRAW